MSLNNDDREVCQRIKYLFEQSGMSQIEFSQSIGVTQGALSNVLRGKNVPGSSFIIAILKEFQNVNSRWLFLGEEPIFSTPDQHLSEGRKRIQNNIVFKSNESGINSGSGNLNIGASDTNPEILNELKKFKEKCEELQSQLNKKNDEINQISAEYIAFLKNRK